MSALTKKVATQLDQQFPPEFDEKWVNLLLTDKEVKTSINTSSSKQKLSAEKTTQLIEAELRKQRIIRRTKRLNKQAPSPKPKKIVPMSAIEKQKLAFRNKNKIKTNPTVDTPSRNIIRDILSRFRKR